MKVRVTIILLLAAAGFSACSTNSVSKIPSISLIAFVPDIMKVGFDTPYIKFSFADGDADIGNDTASLIYIKDNRYDSMGFVRMAFPAIDGALEDPKKGVQGICLFFPDYPTTRPDSLHSLLGDTLTYEFYIKDRAGHSSNHIITPRLIIRP